MTATLEEAAREMLEVVPTVMRDIRSEMRNRRSPDLTVPQFRTLAFVNRNEGSSLLDVANHMGLTPPSACRLVDGLITRGMMTRQDNPADRRRVRLAATPSGMTILEASRRKTMAYLADKLKGVSAEDREIIVKAMEALRSVFTTGQQLAAAK
ncbi:MAG TPA: MarR family transcriptional regulator [Candidatus Acidoferrales bacterium]|nr:MarR family transcriptional regulator [Candidatus Acidoferrales bacterium]